MVEFMITYVLLKWFLFSGWSWTAYTWFLVWLACTTLLALFALNERNKQRQALTCPLCMRTLVRDAATHQYRCPKCTSGLPND
jgi:hypothetical protein